MRCAASWRRKDYDARDEELMFNEMQAYLMFTRDPMFFTPDMVDMTQARLAELQARFLTGMPAGWLREPRWQVLGARSRHR